MGDTQAKYPALVTECRRPAELIESRMAQIAGGDAFRRRAAPPLGGMRFTRPISESPQLAENGKSLSRQSISIQKIYFQGRCLFINSNPDCPRNKSGGNSTAFKSWKWFPFYFLAAPLLFHVHADAQNTVVEYAVNGPKFKRSKTVGAKWRIVVGLKPGTNTIAIRTRNLSTGKTSAVKKLVFKS
jgi:hypothetical protein